MDSPTSSTASRRRTFDLPKSSPDAGLAEWTSKIKAIQQEVDRDEEKEQRRLQEEITKSRLDRARRRNTGTSSIDSTKRSASPLSEPLGEAQATVDQRQSNSDVLKKLSESTTSNPSSLNTSVSATSKREPTSLAAFMGGKATGPKLNKPSPQVNSYDPNLFDQTRREGPHPVFGRPSDVLAATNRFAFKPQSPDTKKQESRLDQNTSKPSISTIPLTPQISATHPEQIVDDVIRSSPEIAKKSDVLRKYPDKTISTSGTPPDIPTKPQFPRAQLQRPHSSSNDTTPLKPTSLAEVIGGRASTPRLTRHPAVEPLDAVPSSARLPAHGRALPGMGNTHRDNSSPAITSTPPNRSLSHSSSQQDITSHTSSNPHTPQKRSPSGSMPVTPALARPIQPQVTVPQPPVAIASRNPSPAFLRVVPSTQDLHPSLSRLQGRGFVEQRVKASSQLYGGSPPQQKERSISPGSSPQRPTVLDRWQPALISPSPSPSPSNAPSIQREETNVIPGTRSKSVQQVIRPGTISSGLVKPRIEDTEQERAAPVRLPGMASSTSFPLRNRAPLDSSPSPDRLDGARVIENHDAHRNRRDMSGVTGPLSHPTRDRARKPRKAPGPSKMDKDPVGIKNSDFKPGAEVPQAKDKSQDGDKEFEHHQRLPYPEAKRQPSPSALDNLQRLKDTLTYKPPIEVPATSISTSKVQSILANGFSSAPAAQQGPVSKTREAISSTASPLIAPRPMTPSSPSSVLDESPMTPSRHSRIPSTGQRATVMDVAQALQQHEQHIREASWTPEPEPLPQEIPARQVSLLDNDGVDDTPCTDVKAKIAGWGRNGQQPERRRSSYDRFPVPTLPPLVEVKTPAATPQGSLSRGFTQIERAGSEMYKRVQEAVSEAAIPVAAVEVGLPESQPELKPEPWRQPKAEDSLIHLEHHDSLPPPFNLQSVLKEMHFSPDLNFQTISVDIFVISGRTATAVTREPNVFYDSEVVTIIHRAKGNTGQLMSNKVWIWRGRNANFEEKEERKAKELTERFGTTGISCFQGSEPPDLIHALGGVLAIRQGIRAHWSSENTTMHRVHSTGDSMFVDEVDLNISNLCSAYSYCLSILGALYVWHGRGASEDERKVALTYGHSLTNGSNNVIEFEEGKEDEMFWMVLGDDGYANADYWRFKVQLDRLGARIFVIDSSKTKFAVQALPSISVQDIPNDSIFVVDCRLEVFVVVSSNARGNRTDIQLALILAENISAASAPKRPFDPPIHVVILPSQLPKELLACIRLCDEKKLNDGFIPDHMNLLSLTQALDHMQRRSWPRSVLSDPAFLPLGVSPAML